MSDEDPFAIPIGRRQKPDQQINWPMEMERRNRELAAMTEERDTLAAVVVEVSKDRDEWRQAVGVEAGLRRELRALAEKLQGCLDNYQRTFDLQWEADMRAVKRWREAHPGNELVLPDRANMVVWLLEEHDRLRRTAGEA